MTSNNEELQRKLGILKERFEAGKITVSPSVYDKIASSLEAVRLDANGKVDLSTVDASVRSMANAVTFYHDREENKKSIPLQEIQRAYFGFIEVNFASFYKMMLETKKDPYIVARFFSEDKSRRESILKSIPEFLEHIKELWESYGDVAWDHLEDMNCLKLSHAGDFFPSYTHNVASKCGLYSDTIVLPDPFVRTFELSDMLNDKQKVFYFIKHALNVLAYKDLALAELTTPIIVILPEPKFFEEHEGELIHNLAEADCLKLAGNAFERTFESMDDAREFFGSLDDKHKVLREIKDESKVLADVEVGNEVEKQLDELCNVPFGSMEKLNPGEVVLTNFLGRMGQANDALLKSRRVRGVPLIDAPTSWRYFNWKLQLDGSRFNHEQNVHLHCSHALSSLDGTELSWLGNIPPESLIEIRQQGALEEIRDIMTSNIDSLTKVAPENFGQTTYQVYKNFQGAFDAHNQKLAELRVKKWRFAGVDIGSMICTGAIELAAAATGSPLFGIVSWAAGQVLNTPKIREIPQKYRDLVEEDKKVANSPVGLLVKCKE